MGGLNIHTITLPPLEDDAIKGIFQNVKQPDKIINRLVIMSKGNPGGATVLAKLFEDVKPEEALKDVDILDKAKIYGGNMWIGYKDFCKQDIKAFRKELRSGNVIRQIKSSRDFITRY